MLLMEKLSHSVTILGQQKLTKSQLRELEGEEPEPAIEPAACGGALPAPVPVQPDEFDELLDFMTLCFGQGDFQTILPRLYQKELAGLNHVIRMPADPPPASGHSSAPIRSCVMLAPHDLLVGEGQFHSFTGLA